MRIPTEYLAVVTDMTNVTIANTESRMAYLRLTLSHSKGQGQGQGDAHFD